MKIIDGNIINVAQELLKQNKKVAIIHQTNCQGKIGAGISKAIIQRFPKVKTDFDYLTKVTTSNERYGLLQTVRAEENAIIFNSYSQFQYGNGKRLNKKFTTESYLLHNIDVALKHCKENDIMLLAPYKIGAGLANGNWDTILSHLEKTNIVLVKL